MKLTLAAALFSMFNQGPQNVPPDTLIIAPNSNSIRTEILEDILHFQDKVNRQENIMRVPVDSAIIVNGNNLEELSRTTFRNRIKEKQRQRRIDRTTNPQSIPGKKELIEDALSKYTKFDLIMQAPFDSLGLAREYTVIPLIETLLENAYSWAHAAGTWQFQKGTAKQNMIVNKSIDQRYSLVFSSEAAAKHIKGLESMYEDYKFVLSSYIRGAYGVAKDLENMLEVKEENDNLFFPFYSDIVEFHQPKDNRPYSFDEFNDKIVRYRPRSLRRQDDESLREYRNRIYDFEYTVNNMLPQDRYAQYIYEVTGASQGQNRFNPERPLSFNEYIDMMVRNYRYIAFMGGNTPDAILQQYADYITPKEFELVSFSDFVGIDEPMSNIYYDYHEYLINETSNFFATPNYVIRFLGYYAALNGELDFDFTIHPSISVEKMLTQRPESRTSLGLTDYDNRLINGHIRKTVPENTEYFNIVMPAYKTDD